MTVITTQNDATDYESGKPLVMKMKWKISDIAGMKIRVRVPDTKDGFAVLIRNPKHASV